MELQKLSGTTDAIIKIGAIVAGICAIAGGYSFILSNIWIPAVNIKSIDYLNGTATVTYKNIIWQQVTLSIYGNETFILDGSWGIRFGTTIMPEGRTSYDTLELIKNAMVYTVIQKRS